MSKWELWVKYTRTVEKRAKIEKIKSVPCLDCGNSYPPEAMDFDHVRGTKKFNISTAHSKSWRVIEEEIAKCEVVCANCHRVRTRRRLKTR